MTLDAKEPTPAAATDEQGRQEQPTPLVYEPPVLTALGNVHSLLAAGGVSITSDGTKGQMRV